MICLLGFVSGDEQDDDIPMPSYDVRGNII